MGWNPLEKAGENERVVELLGAPIEDCVRVTIDVDEVKRGIADYSCTLVGSKAKGKLVIKARKVGETWIYEAVRVDVGDESIDLMPMDSFKLRRGE